jgi:D-arginine dehydrogenase
LAKGKRVSELQRIASGVRGAGIDFEWLSHREALKRVPVLSGGDFSRALFCPSDAVVEIDALLGRFSDELKKKGVPVLRGCPIRSIQKTTRGFLVQAGTRKILTQKIINAAGAWASLVAIRARASHVPLLAYQRHLFESRRFPSAKKNWPFVWDLSHEFYFRPVKEGFLMLSACDKTLRRVQAAGAVEGEKIDPRMESVLLKKMNKFSGNFGSLRIASVKSGLRTITPDGRFVIGEDPKLKDFYWVAGLGGHGVTTCFAVGRLAGNIISGKKVDRNIAKAFSPGRF